MLMHKHKNKHMHKDMLIHKHMHKHMLMHKNKNKHMHKHMLIHKHKHKHKHAQGHAHPFVISLWVIALMFCVCVCLRSQFVASPKCQHILKRLITRPEDDQQKTGTSKEETSSKVNWAACFRYLWYGPRGKQIHLSFLIQLILWVAIVYPLTIMLGLLLYPILYICPCVCQCDCSCVRQCKDCPKRKEWQQMIFNKFEHPYCKFQNHTMFYVAFLCLVFASAFENEFDHAVFLGLSKLRKLTTF